MARCPFAIWRPMPYATSLMPNPVRTNLHTAVTSASSLFSYFAYQSGGVHSHFYVAKDGTIEQYRDTASRAAADLKGNPDTISIESWDGYPNTFTSSSDVPAWTDAQVEALRRLVAWVIDTHPTIPRRLATDSKVGPSSHGVSWHRLGVPATYAQLALNRSQTGGMLYSKSVGKTCPGDRRIAQIPGLLAAPASGGGPSGGMSPVVVPAPTPAPAPVKNARAHRTYATGEVKRIQRILSELGYYKGDLDDDYGNWTHDAAEAYQRAQLFGGLVPDGDWGPATDGHHGWTIILQRAMNAWRGDDIAVDGDYRRVTDARVWDLMRRNETGAYATAGRQLGYSRVLVDGVPGRVFCHMLSIPTHP